MKINAYTIGGAGASALGVVLFYLACFVFEALPRPDSGGFLSDLYMWALIFLLWTSYAGPVIGFLYFARRLHWWSAILLLVITFAAYYLATWWGWQTWPNSDGMFSVGAQCGALAAAIVLITLLPLDGKLRAPWRLGLYAVAFLLLALVGGIGLQAFPTFGWIGLAYAPWQAVFAITLVAAFEGVNRPGVI
jgi:hypothetical protein